MPCSRVAPSTGLGRSQRSRQQETAATHSGHEPENQGIREVTALNQECLPKMKPPSYACKLVLSVTRQHEPNLFPTSRWRHIHLLEDDPHIPPTRSHLIHRAYYVSDIDCTPICSGDLLSKCC